MKGTLRGGSVQTAGFTAELHVPQEWKLLKTDAEWISSTSWLLRQLCSLQRQLQELQSILSNLLIANGERSLRAKHNFLITNC